MTKPDGRGRPPMKIISLGWGVQSFALSAMSALGILPPVDAAVHADTGWERAETYAFAKRWTPWLEERGVRVVTVQDKSQSSKMLTGEPDAPLFTLTDQWGGLSIPAHTSWPGSGVSSGMLRRQCTQRWKIAPMRRWISAELKRREMKKSPDVVEKWLGISWDEARRTQSSSDIKYITLKYPLIEMLGQPWTRQMIIRWLQDNNLEVPPKSSCIICPYHDRATWREIRLSGNGDWEKALAVDRAIRDRRPGYSCYLTSQRKPLDECDFRSQEEHGQLTLWTGAKGKPND